MKLDQKWLQNTKHSQSQEEEVDMSCGSFEVFPRSVRRWDWPVRENTQRTCHVREVNAGFVTNASESQREYSALYTGWANFLSSAPQNQNLISITYVGICCERRWYLSTAMWVTCATGGPAPRKSKWNITGLRTEDRTCSTVILSHRMQRPRPVLRSLLKKGATKIKGISEPVKDGDADIWLRGSAWGMTTTIYHNNTRDIRNIVRRSHNHFR